MKQKRSPESIIAEVNELHRKNEDLSYGSMNRRHSALFRTAIRHFGSWQSAVEAAGIPYQGIRRYKAWSKERVVERIRELDAAGEELSWRRISTTVDPQLAAAATRAGTFGSWRKAVEAAGFDYNGIRRYKDWDEDRILEELKALNSAGEPLNAGRVCQRSTALITAARRTFGTWDNALSAAGLDPGGIRRRAPGQRRSRRAREQEAA